MVIDTEGQYLQPDFHSDLFQIQVSSSIICLKFETVANPKSFLNTSL